MPPVEDRRFNSWKEIATFLDRDIRTVWRWEKERGLPVHRVPGDGRRAVFAYQQEIEAWLKSAEHLSGSVTDELLGNAESAGRLAAGSTPRDSKTKLRKSALAWGLGVAFVLGVAAIVLFERAGRTQILGVSPVSADLNQSIVIEGKGFGPPPKTILITPNGGGVDTFADNYSTSIRIDDLGNGPHHWIAGRAGPLNYCDITLKLTSWEDNRIVLAGFAGPLGTTCEDRYQIAPGDRLQIIIWGPRNRCGPGGPPQCLDEIKAGRVATFDTVVLPSKEIQASECR